VWKRKKRGISGRVLIPSKAPLTHAVKKFSLFVYMRFSPLCTRGPIELLPSVYMRFSPFTQCPRGAHVLPLFSIPEGIKSGQKMPVNSSEPEETTWENSAFLLVRLFLFSPPPVACFGYFFFNLFLFFSSAIFPATGGVLRLFFNLIYFFLRLFSATGGVNGFGYFFRRLAIFFRLIVSFSFFSK